MKRLIKKSNNVDPDMEEKLRSAGMQASKLSKTKDIMYNVIENFLNENTSMLENSSNEDEVINNFAEYCKDNADDIIEKFNDELCEVTNIDDGEIFYNLDSLIKDEIIDDLIVGTTSTLYDVIDAVSITL